MVDSFLGVMKSGLFYAEKIESVENFTKVFKMNMSMYRTKRIEPWLNEKSADCIRTLGKEIIWGHFILTQPLCENCSFR